MSFKTYLELNYNQVLIRKYEIISADFESSRQTRIHTERGHIRTSFLFRKYPLVPDDTNNYELQLVLCRVAAVKRLPVHQP